MFTRTRMVASAALLVAVGLAAWVFLAPGRPPSPEGDPVAVARFVGTSQYRNLPEEGRRPYMKALREKEKWDAVVAAHRAGKLNKAEYEAAYLSRWLERQLDHMGDYYKTPADRRQQALVEDYARKSRQSRSDASAEAGAPEVEDEAEERFVAEWTKEWSAEERARWDEYQRAVRKAKEAARPPASVPSRGER